MKSLLFRLKPLIGPLVTHIDMLCLILFVVFNEGTDSNGYDKCQQTPRSLNPHVS